MKKGIVIAAAMALSVGLCGCGQDATAEVSYQPKSAKSDFKTVGMKKNKESIFVYNETGAKIRGIKVRKSGQKEWSKEVLQKNQVIKNKEKVELYLPVKVKNTYDVQLTFSGKDTKTLSKVKISDMESIRVFKKSKIAYIEYISKNKKDIVSTKAAEEKILAKAEAKAKAEAERKAAEEAARRQAEAEAAAAASRQRSSGSSSSSKKRSADNCADSGNDGKYVSDGKDGWKFVKPKKK